MRGKRGAVHMSCYKHVGFHGFVDRNAADKWWNFAGDLVESANWTCLAESFTPAFSSSVFRLGPENLALPTRTLAPLDSGDLRILQRAAVAGALHRVDDRVNGKFFEIGESERERLFDFAGDGELPRLGFKFVRLETYGCGRRSD